MCKRNTSWLPLASIQTGTWPTTQACALTGNWTHGLSVHRPALNPLSHSSQGWRSCFVFSRRSSRGLDTKKWEKPLWFVPSCDWSISCSDLIGYHCSVITNLLYKVLAGLSEDFVLLAQKANLWWLWKLNCGDLLVCFLLILHFFSFVLTLLSHFSFLLNIFFFKILFLAIRGQKEKGGGRNIDMQDKHPLVVFCIPPTGGDLARSPGMCPDQESNLGPFGL